MTVWIVKTDTAAQDEPAAHWVIDKVFESEADARAYAAADIHREVEPHEVIGAHS